MNLSGPAHANAPDISVPSHQIRWLICHVVKLRFTFVDCCLAEFTPAVEVSKSYNIYFESSSCIARFFLVSSMQNLRNIDHT
jgi:hypothetical protein